MNTATPLNPVSPDAFAQLFTASDLTALHGMRVLERARTIACKTRGQCGEVRIFPALDADGKFREAIVFVRHDHEIARHATTADAIRHLVDLVGPKAAQAAIERAAQRGPRSDGSFDPCAVEAVIQERTTADGSGEHLAYGLFPFARHHAPVARFILRMGIAPDGIAYGGGSLYPADATLADVLREWAERCDR